VVVHVPSDVCSTPVPVVLSEPKFSTSVDVAESPDDVEIYSESTE